MRWLWAALFAATISSAVSAAPQTLAGRVLDAEGAPVAGAEVTAYFKFNLLNLPQPHLVRLERAGRWQTGADGSFALELTIPPDCIEVVAIGRKGDLAPSWASFDSSWGWGAQGPKDIVLEPPASIGGTVSDEAGKPVPNAEVTADLYLSPEPGRIQRRIGGGPPLDWLRTKTDADGRFTIKDLPKSSSADLHVTALGKGGLYIEKRGEQFGPFAAGAADIRVTLQPEARIQGTVLDEETRKPLAGVSVLVTANSGTIETDAQVCVTGADGAFEAPGLPAADYKIALANQPGRMPVALAKSVAVKDVQTGEVRKEVVLTTTPGCVLEVLVTNEKKEPVSGAQVLVQEYRDGSFTRGGYSFTYSDKDGIAAFRLRPGSYQISQAQTDELYFRFDQNDKTQVALEVETGKTLRANVALKETPYAAGVALDPQGKPVPGATVAFFPYAMNLAALTDKDGRFLMRSLQLNDNGRLRSVIARKPDAGLVGIVNLEDQQEKNIRIAMSPGLTLSGSVVDPDNRPIAGAQVSVIWRRDDAASEAKGLGAGTGKDGSYAIRALPDDGDYSVKAAANGFGSGQRAVELNTAKDRVVTVPAVTLKRANLTIAGIVVDADDKPVSGAQVDFYGEEQNFPGGVRSDKDGKFTLKNLCAAEARIQAWKTVDGEQEQGSIAWTADMKEVKIVLGENAGRQNQGAESLHASGVILDAQGKPVADATVQVQPFGGELRRTDKDGKFKVSWQQWPGNNQQGFLMVRAPKADLAAAFPLEDAGKLDDLKITLAPAITITGTVADPDNKPIAGANIQTSYQHNNYGASLLDQSISDRDGKFAIHTLPGDLSYQVAATANGFGMKQSPVDLTAARDHAVEMAPLTLKRANLAVAGIVVDDEDKPVAGAQINVAGAEQSLRATTRSDKDGKFTLKNLCDAEATIQAWKTVDGEQEQGSIAWTADIKEVKIVLGENVGQQGPQAQVLRASGGVVDAQGQPVAGADVIMMPFGRQARKTDKAGKFKVSWQQWPGQNTPAFLLVRAPKADLAAMFSLGDADKLDALEIALAPGITITGAVVDPDNKPISRATVQLLLQQPRFNAYLPEQIRIGQDGKYAIHGLPDNMNYQVFAQATGFGRAQSPVDLTAAKDRVIEMPPITLKRANRTVAGTTVDADGKGIFGAQISASGPDQNVQACTSGRDGKFTLRNVCEGELRIEAWKQQLHGSLKYTPEMKEVQIVLVQNQPFQNFGMQMEVVQPQPPTAEELFAAGQKAMDDQNWKESVARFKELAEKYPTYAKTLDALDAAIAICENRLNDQKTADELRKKKALLKGNR